MIHILLATYNSERFLCEQVESIIAQDCQDFELVIRDGGSTDGTVALIEELCSKHSDKIRFIGSCRAGVNENFSALLQAVISEWRDGTAEHYVMFSDHDDVWLPDKISRTLAACRDAAQKVSSEIPIAVFTDSKPVDVNLRVLASSTFRIQGLDPRKRSLNRLLLQNVAQGCTMMVNRALAELVGEIPTDATMYDHWIMLVAAAFGRIACISSPTMLYRQHDGNELGAARYGMLYLFCKLMNGRTAIRRRLCQQTHQAVLLIVRYGARLDARQHQMLSEFSELMTSGFWARRWSLIRHRIFKCGLCRNLGMFAMV